MHLLFLLLNHNQFVDFLKLCGIQNMLVYIQIENKPCKERSILNDMVSKSSKKYPFPFLFITIFSLSFSCIFSLYFKSKNEVPIRTCQYISKYPSWYQVIAREMKGRRRIKVGLVSMNNETSDSIIGCLHGEAAAEVVKVGFDPVDDSVKWDELFPEWINEAAPVQEQKCPEIPMPTHLEDPGLEFDVVVASVPCSNEGSRDVFGLQVNLVVANLLVKGLREYHEDKLKYAVFMGSCGPMWEIFRCDDLLWNEGIWSIYKPSLRKLKQKALMPTGSCQLASPFAEQGQEGWQVSSLESSSLHRKPREAYATILHSTEAYVCGAIALAQSIISNQSNSSTRVRDLVLLADIEHISRKSVQELKAAGWKIKPIKRIRSPHAKKDAYNEWNYSKLMLWKLKEYDKVIFIDSDIIVLRNLDEFFVYPQLSACGNNRHIFNSGLMIVEPSECAFETMMQKRHATHSYNGGDQGFLNEMFTWWHRWPRRANFLKFFSNANDFSRSGKITSDLYTIHYLGLKPWMCYKDYDCNWDVKNYQKFACDSAHQKWWQVYDAIPQKLRPFCELSPNMDRRLKEKRSKARKAGFPDGHWKIKVRDPRIL